MTAAERGALGEVIVVRAAAGDQHIRERAGLGRGLESFGFDIHREQAERSVPHLERRAPVPQAHGIKDPAARLEGERLALGGKDQDRLLARDKEIPLAVRLATVESEGSPVTVQFRAGQFVPLPVEAAEDVMAVGLGRIGILPVIQPAFKRILHNDQPAVGPCVQAFEVGARAILCMLAGICRCGGALVGERFCAAVGGDAVDAIALHVVLPLVLGDGALRDFAPAQRLKARSIGGGFGQNPVGEA